MTTSAQSLERARTLLTMSRPADAERQVRGVLTEEPHHPTAHAFLALALSQQGRHDEARDAAHEAVRLAPEHWFPHYVAGQVHLRARRPDEAVAAAEAALAVAPEQASVWELLARAHVPMGRWPQVIEAARRGLAVDPQQPDLVGLLSLAHTALGEAEPARATAAHALRLNPESATAHLVHGRAALAFGDPRVAADAFRQVLRLDPGFDQARDLLVRALKAGNPLHRALSRLRSRFRGGWWMVCLLPVLPPVIAFFVLIALLHWAAWISEAVTTLRLARAKSTRLLFEGVESRLALLCCCLLAAGATLLGLGIGLGQEVVGTAGAGVMALVTPVQEAAHTGSRGGRKVLYLWAFLLAVAMIWAMVAGSMGPAMLSLYAALATIWVAAGVRRVFGKVS